jgi:DNA replication protein DnaC
MSAPPQTPLERIRAHLVGLKMSRALEALDACVRRVEDGQLSALEFLDELLGEEHTTRESRRIKSSLLTARLTRIKTLEGFDFGFQPSLEKSRIETLATCSWIREHATVLIQGPPGTGKTHIAVALGVKAVENGFSVAFYRLDDLLHAMKQDADVPPQRLRRKKYLNVSLLVIDEVGFQPMSRAEASLFFRLVSYRYGRGSILITTNKGIKDWPELLAGDEVLATAILDRLLHHSHVLNIKGRSYRLRDLEQAVSLRT